MSTIRIAQGQTLADACLAALGDPEAAVAAALLNGIDPAGEPVEEGRDILLPHPLPEPSRQRTAQALAARPPATAMCEGIGGWAVGQATVE